jgi:hypothetical protein
MKNLSFIIVCLISVLLLDGCASTGLTASSHVTNIQLTSPNFKVIATNVSGEASSSAVLGVSYGFGIATTQLALIPIGKERMLYKTAMKNLWTNFEATNGVVKNRRLALVNVRYDSESLNLFFYTRVTTAVVADIVEFE